MTKQKKKPTRKPSNAKAVKPLPLGDVIYKVGYKSSPQCKVCTGKDEDGVPIREEVELMFLRGEQNVKILEWMKRRGLPYHPKNLRSHFKKHAPYALVQKGGLGLQGQQARELMTRVEAEFADANDALQRIINIGDRYVKEGKIPVTERIYMEALKEQGRRRQASKFDTVMIEMEKGWIMGQNIEEGVVVKSKKDSLKSKKKAINANVNTQRAKHRGRGDSEAVSAKLGSSVPQPRIVRNLVSLKRS